MQKLPENYVVFDLETTGFTPQYAEIIEIGALKCVHGVIAETFQTYVCPTDDYIPRRITQITGITYDMVKNAPGFEDAIPSFLAFMGSFPLVGHNVRFDMAFMRTYSRACGCDFEPTAFFDTVPLARRSIKDIENHKLETIKHYFGIDLPSHNAVDDCRVTQYLFEFCKDKSDIYQIKEKKGAV